MKSIGQYIIFLGLLIANRERLSTYFKLFIDEAIIIGVNSIVIVVIISTFMGAVTTLQTAYNLVSPLIDDYVIGLIVRDMTIQELAPTVTAIVFAGKAGSNIAGQLGTMRITEQIDAIDVMGVNSASYLVLPKVLASMFTYPLLVTLSAFLSILGGYLVGISTGIVSGEDYILGIRADFNPFTVGFAYIKSIVFAFLIASISSFKGYYTKGGALEVGIASTSAVTNSCIAILVADYLLAQLLL